MGRLTERQTRWLLAALGGGCFAALMALEILTDPDEITFLDGLVDGIQTLLTIAAAVGVALLAQRMQAQHEERLALIDDLKVARAEGEAWRAKVQASLDGVRSEMQSQFRDWGMTGAEREVGLLILKGLNHKQIAALRGTSEATVRQQAQAIYRKAGLPGRTAFAAFFLEDLLAFDGDAEDKAAAVDATRAAPASEPTLEPQPVAGGRPAGL